MSTNLESMDIEQLLAEADELIQGINSAVLEEMDEEHRLQCEMYLQNLNKYKSEVQGDIGEINSSKLGSGAEGVHEAILEIVKAMKGLTKLMS